MGESKALVNMAQIDAEAKMTATNHIINMFQRPGQLEKVEQFKRTHLRKKASVEAKLKSGMQSQLDGVRVGLNQLHICLQEVKDVEQRLKSVNSLFANVPKLCEQLKEVREENMRHSQYVTAIENLKHIFTVPESVEKTKHWINEGKLLLAHQCLSDLENSRDELLLELYKLPNQSPHDTSMLKAYFEEVEKLSDMLGKQLHLVLSRTLNTVRKEPTVIVTAMRIIEREEKADKEQNNKFIPPGRPKRWKKMAYDVLKNSVATRIEGTHIDEREDDKLWLVKYLELTRQLILEDLRVVKTLCVPCFPAHYNILTQYTDWYHECLSRHLEEIVQNGLEGNEYVSVLAWTLNTYKSEELMGHPELKDSTQHLGALFPTDVLHTLQKDYLNNMRTNYVEWIQNTLKSECEEWYLKKPPQCEDKYLRTVTPVILFQMIDQNLQVTKTISQQLTFSALELSIDQIIKYGDMYKDAIIAFKNKHFEDRSQLPYFTQYMITIVNNCHQITELSSQFEHQYKLPGAPPSVGYIFKHLNEKYMNLRNESGNYLLEEVFLDLDKQFEEIFSSRWLLSSIAIDTICVTLEDYFQDYNRLVHDNFKYTISTGLLLIAKRYIMAMLSKRTSFKSFDECQSAANKVVKEVNQLQDVFSKISEYSIEENPLDTVILLSEIIKCENDMLSLDLHRIVEKYADITEDHLLRLLYLRGDIPRSDMREKVAHVVKSSNAHNLSKSSIFQQIVFPKLNLGF